MNLHNHTYVVNESDIDKPISFTNPYNRARTVDNNIKYESSINLHNYNYIVEDSDNIRHISFAWLNKNLCRLAVMRKGSSLQYVPSMYKTVSLCIIAVKHDNYALQYVPFEYLTPKFYRAIFGEWSDPDENDN